MQQERKEFPLHSQEILSLQEILQYCKSAELLQPGEVTSFTKLACDTRDIDREGTIFCAIRGGGPWYGVAGEGADEYKFDFHKYIPQAVLKGAQGILLERLDFPIDKKITVIKVPNVIEVLGELTREKILSYGIKVTGVTGSTGKSSTCELVATVLRERWPTFKFLSDRATPISVPSQFLNANLSQFERVVVEMPMDGLGQISKLCEIAPPDNSVILNINDSHIVQLGSLENIIKAKKEIVDSLGLEGVAVLNGDDPNVLKIANSFEGNKILFGLRENLDVSASNIKLTLKGTEFDLKIGKERDRLHLRFIGVKSVYSALAAAGVGLVNGLSIEEIKKGLESFRPLPSRLSILEGKKGQIILDDTRLATPASSVQMLSVISEIPRGEEKRRIIVQGPILRPYQHGSVKDETFKLIANGFEGVILVGEASEYQSKILKHTQKPIWIGVFNNPEEAGQWLEQNTDEGDFIVFNGSEQALMGRAVEQVVKEDELRFVYKRE